MYDTYHLPTCTTDSLPPPRSPQLLRPRTRRDRTAVFWVSYMSGAQRALLFTQDERQATRLRRQVDGERAKLELFVSLRAAGLSLVRLGHSAALCGRERSVG